MDLLSRLLANAPDDPLLLAAVAVAAWLPICAVGLGLLALLSTVQYRLSTRRRARAAISLPPPELRPLAARRYVSDAARAHPVFSVARVGMVVVVVLAFTAIVLRANGPVLLSALKR